MTPTLVGGVIVVLLILTLILDGPGQAAEMLGCVAFGLLALVVPFGLFALGVYFWGGG